MIETAEYRRWLMDLSREQILEVPCIICDAQIGEPCRDLDRNVIMLRGFHRQRVDLRSKLPNLPPEEELSATDKSLITYYAFVMICDSVAAHSLRFMGKQFTSAQVQRKFAREAIEALRIDGLFTKKDSKNVASESATVAE